MITLGLSREAVETQPVVASPQPQIVERTPTPAAAEPERVNVPAAAPALGTTGTTITVDPKSPPPASPSAATTSSSLSASRPRVAAKGFRGSLVVNSQPRGANVFINNELAGRTPLVLPSVPAGSRAVHVRLDGYSTWSRAVSVVANQSTTVLAQLTRVPTEN